MTIDFRSLNKISLPLQTKSDIEADERGCRKLLFDAMQPLKYHDIFNTKFENCCIYAMRYDPLSVNADFQQEVYQFELSRMQYLKCVVSFARELFPGKQQAEQKLFELSQRKLRAIDPLLIGESRYQVADWFYVKIYKVILHFFWGQLYMWGNREQIRTWAARHDILKWGATQYPKTMMHVPIDFKGFDHIDSSDFTLRTTRDKLIHDIFLKALGFQKDDIKVLQGFLELFPGEIKKFGYHPSIKRAHIVLEKQYVGRPDWAQIDKDTRNDIPKIFAPISILIDDLQKREIPIPDVLKVVGDQLAIVTREIHLQIAEILDGEIVQGQDEIGIWFESGKIRCIIPAHFGFFRPDIYVDILAMRRNKNGDLSFEIGIGASAGFDTTMKGLVLAITKLFLNKASTTMSLPLKEEGSICLPKEHEVKEILENVKKYLSWNI